MHWDFCFKYDICIYSDVMNEIIQSWEKSNGSTSDRYVALVHSESGGYYKAKDSKMAMELIGSINEYILNEIALYDVFFSRNEKNEVSVKTYLQNRPNNVMHRSRLRRPADP